MLMFEILRATQVNYVRYAQKRAAGMSLTQSKQRPIEQYLVRLSANNDLFDKVLCQMFRVDPFQATMRSLDLSLRFFKGSFKGQQKAITLPEFLSSDDYFNYYKGLRGYDDEQRLILMSLHYNSNLSMHLEKEHGVKLHVISSR
jgi:hypothetical protein